MENLSLLLEQLAKVFIVDNRYKLILRGLGSTIGISFVAVIIGTVLGLIVALTKLLNAQKNLRSLISLNKKLRKEGNNLRIFYEIIAFILSKLAGAYIDIIRGTPVVVQLMIMYFIIFKGKYGFLVAVVTFGINSSAYVAEIIRAGIQAVDIGQTEGGRSLGLNHIQTMRFIIIPQAIKNILPALGNEFIVLIKETSIVGYVSIQDLTKAFDFIISRTYTSFVPLISLAIIYFLIVKIITKLLERFERRLRKSDSR